MKRLRERASGAHESDVFRRRVDDKISVDEYVKHLDEQVEQRRQTEDHPRTDADRKRDT
jgi:hypothetical protein